MNTVNYYTYQKWQRKSPTSPRSGSKTLIHRDRSRSPPREYENSNLLHQSYEENHSEFQFKRRVPNEYFKPAPESTNHAKEIEFGGKSPELERLNETEYRKRQEMEYRKLEELWNSDGGKGTETKERGVENTESGIQEDDLRIMLEKNRTIHQTSPNKDAEKMINPGTHDGNAHNTGVSGNNRVNIPGLDLEGKLQSQGRLLGNSGSKVAPETENVREVLMQNFKSDCDTVAQVTQLLINEIPSLEDPLTEAMKGVLQKLMKKHLNGMKN